MWTTPPGISITPTNTVVDANTLQSTITFTAATSSYAGEYQCIATVGSDRFNSDTATLTVNYYSVQFEDPLYTVHEASDTFIFFVGTSVIGSPSQNALVSFARDDSGPAINDLTISMATPTSVFIEALIPNDNIRLGDRVIRLMLVTSDDLVEFGAQSETAVEVTEDDLDPPLAITPPVLRVTTGSDALLMATEYITDLALDYTWFFNGRFFFNTPNEYSGQFTSNLTVLNAQESDEGNYTVEVFLGGAGGRVTAQLFVFAPVNIVSHPMNTTVNVSDIATLLVDATGEGLTYQWKKHGVGLTEMAGKLEGVNSPTLRVFDAQTTDEGFYSCVVTNGAGDSEISDEAFLETIGSTSPPQVLNNVFFELGGRMFLNNSAIRLSEVGEGRRALFCRTDNVACCRTPPNNAGQFYFPSGERVRTRRFGQGLYRNRRSQHIRLNRRIGVTTPTSVYRCEIPDSSDVIQRIFINLTA